MLKKIIGLAAAASFSLFAPAHAKELSLAYFMGPKHPMNAAVFTPFAEKLAEVSGGQLTVKQYPGGALNSVPPKQYAILLDGVSDIVFTLPGYTGDVFPMTNVVTLPGVCSDPVDCTQALLNAKDILETEYNAKVLEIWANAPSILITRDTPVRTLEDLQGMKIRVTSRQQVPFVNALGASAVAQPVTVVNQNLANGVIDGVLISPAGIGTFKLYEPGNYLTTWFPGSGSAFVLLMNRDVYDSMTDEQRGWIDAAASDDLAFAGAQGFLRAGQRGLRLAAENGVEIIDLPEEEKARWNAIIAPVLDAELAKKAGDHTVGEIYSVMRGE